MKDQLKTIDVDELKLVTGGKDCDGFPCQAWQETDSRWGGNPGCDGGNSAYGQCYKAH